MLDKRLRLGTFFGIDLFVHWTFGLLIAYMVAISWAEGPSGVGYAVARLFGVFLCVTLHEYGHALTARAFDVPTIDITLLPIGGVARLKHMPRVPWQELLVAVAGPAVNVVIIGLLLAGLYLFQLAFGTAFFSVPASALQFSWSSLNELAIWISDRVIQPSLGGFVLTMLLVNTMLVLFNMIPAFPMDGGRVLRSILAMITNYRRATFIASRIGVVCAAGMAIFALQVGEFMPLLIAGFIAFAGMNEARQVDVMESLRGLSVADVMIRQTDGIPMNTSLRDVATQWRSSLATVMPVTSFVGSVVGIIRLTDVAKAIDDGMNLETPIGELADHAIAPASLDEPLESIVLSGSKQNRVYPVLDHAGMLIGILDLDTILARGQLKPMAMAAENAMTMDVPGSGASTANPYESTQNPSQFDTLT